MGRCLDRARSLRFVNGPRTWQASRHGRRCCATLVPHVDYIALHTYFDKRSTDTAGFLASADVMDRFIKEVVAICDGVAAQLRSERRIMICFDEWNVWYRTRDSIRRDKLAWSSAPL